MLQGYVKLWRKSLESPIWRNPKLWRFWSWCLMKANYLPREQVVGYQSVELEPGQFIFGRHKASQETGLSEREIRTSLDALRKMENLTIKTTNKFSIISILNWDFYQGGVTNNSTSNRPATDQQPTTNKKVKKEKKYIDIPDWIRDDIWTEYLEMRKKRKNPPTEYAKVLIIKELSKLDKEGNDPNEVLNQSIKRGWLGVFPLKNQGNQSGTQDISPDEYIGKYSHLKRRQ